MTPEAKKFLNKQMHWMASHGIKPYAARYTAEELRTKAKALRRYEREIISQFLDTL